MNPEAKTVQKRKSDMAFFEKLRRAFGLDDSVDYDDEIEEIGRAHV